MPELFTHWWFWIGTGVASIAASFGMALAMLRAKRRADPFAADSTKDTGR
ncbi:hypothetical protein [Acetobacter estunensis]|nr:hypothetical protein [Acetobacter estunensis]MBV1835676.1 hypothetical protein [Acetobacter estunensis]MBV1836063.1 hypothetical protein [Acetobacter estunensis]